MDRSSGARSEREVPADDAVLPVLWGVASSTQLSFSPSSGLLNCSLLNPSSSFVLYKAMSQSRMLISQNSDPGGLTPKPRLLTPASYVLPPSGWEGWMEGRKRGREKGRKGRQAGRQAGWMIIFQVVRKE